MVYSFHYTRRGNLVCCGNIYLCKDEGGRTRQMNYDKDILVLEEIIKFGSLFVRHKDAVRTAIQALKALKEAGEEIPDCNDKFSFTYKNGYYTCQELAVPIVQKKNLRIAELEKRLDTNPDK